jgi:hypothetical protein
MGRGREMMMWNPGEKKILHQNMSRKEEVDI